VCVCVCVCVLRLWLLHAVCAIALAIKSS